MKLFILAVTLAFISCNEARFSFRKGIKDGIKFKDCGKYTIFKIYSISLFLNFKIYQLKDLKPEQLPVFKYKLNIKQV